MIKHPTHKELRLKTVDVNKALVIVQAMYDRAELGPLNFKIRSDAQWTLRRASPTSLVYDKNTPGPGKKHESKTSIE